MCTDKPVRQPVSGSLESCTVSEPVLEDLLETAAIPELVRTAPSHVREMIEREAAMPAHRNPTKAVAAMTDQEPRSLEELNRLIAAADPMVEGGTRAVLGEGPVGAAIAFVGEQPADQEDLQARPFVGPPAKSSTARWPRSASSARRPTSQTP
jgi:DNA polymerase